MKIIKACFIENVHDGIPLAGHAWYQGKYHYFEIENLDIESEIYNLYELPWEDMIGALASRKLFEDLVGYAHSRLPDGDFVAGELHYDSFFKADAFYKNVPKVWNFDPENAILVGKYHYNFFQFRNESDTFGL